MEGSLVLCNHIARPHWLVGPHWVDRMADPIHIAELYTLVGDILKTDIHVQSNNVNAKYPAYEVP